MSPTFTSFARTPKPPYYAVIFTSRRSESDRGYGQMAERMVQLASEQAGFLGVETVRGNDGFGITVSYWTSEEAIASWKANAEHKLAQEEGKRVWYADYQVRVAKVERAYGESGHVNDELREFEIRLDDLNGCEVAELLAEHLRCMARVSPQKSRHALSLDELRASDITFWSVWKGRELVGCGALKELDGEHGEIKSMRTAEAHLRKGVASLLVEHIIAEAKRRGYRRLSLKTGSMKYFDRAHKLYRKFGFQTCPPFAGYREDANSLFMTMKL